MSGTCRAAMLATAGAACLGCWGTIAEAAPKVVVFPIEVPDQIREGEFLPRPDKADQPRIALATEELRRLLSAGGRYEIVDLAPLGAELAAAQPLHKCNGCDMELARKAGAEIAVTGLVEKASDVLLNMSLEMRDVATGKVVRMGGTVIQGNTDDMWLRSVRWIIKNRILGEDTAK